MVRGADTLYGETDNDRLTGGSGNDTFTFNVGSQGDTIGDFTAGAATDDVIGLVGFGTAFDSFAEVIAAASDDGFGNTVIDFGGGQTIAIENVAVVQLDSADFIFG
ncbi:MAG: hypothetical protein R3C60_01655 [Parvularculaceae bacterium]